MRRVTLMWILAALLGFAAVHGTMRAIHHPRPSADIMAHLSEVAAEFAVAVAEGRLEKVGRLEGWKVGRLEGGKVGKWAGEFVLHVDSAGKRAVLTTEGGDSLGFDAPELMARLFSPDGAGKFGSHLTISAPSGVVLYRSPEKEPPYHATIHGSGPLRELSIRAGLDPPTGMLASFARVADDQLWFSLILLVSAVLMIVFAAVATRREALLARARSDFIAGVSHELRMPLAQILLASETLSLEREPDARRQVGLATSIVREARRLAGLVDNVLLVARSGAVRLKPTLGPVQVAELFGEVEEAVHLAVEDAGQRLAVQTADGLAVQGDRQLLRQALANLIDNARKYGAPGQTVRLGSAASNGEVRLFVENDGPRIPASEREKLFRPYQRLDRDQSSERTGSGLGLSVVAQIASACGGRVWLEDAEPRGTRAVLALKAASA